MDPDSGWISDCPTRMPRWEDIKARDEWIEEIIECNDAAKEYEDEKLAPERERLSSEYVEFHAARFTEEEEREFDALKAIWPPGGLKPTRTLEPLPALLRDVQSRDELSPLIRQVVDDLIPVRTGRPGRPRVARLPKRRRGRPRMLEEERRKISPVHNADEELSLVKKIMSSAYPDQSAEEITDAAIELVSRRHGVDATALRTYSTRSKKDRHRARNHPRYRPR